MEEIKLGTFTQDMPNLTLKGFEETSELLALRNKESKYPIFGFRFLLDENKIRELGYEPE